MVSEPAGAAHPPNFGPAGLNNAGNLDLLPSLSLGSAALSFPEATFAADSPFDLGLDFLAAEQQGTLHPLFLMAVHIGM